MERAKSAIREWAGEDATCVVICGGYAQRMAPLSTRLPKSLVPIADRPLLEWLLRFWRDHVDRFVFVVNHLHDALRPTIERAGVRYEIVVEPPPPLGIAGAVNRARPFVGDRFVVVLGDELLRGHVEVPLGADMGIGVLPDAGVETIRLAYSVELDGDRVRRVVEKPRDPAPGPCGTGFYFLTPAIFSAIERTPPSRLKGQVEMTDAIQTLVDAGHALAPFWLRGDWINVTYPSDLERASAWFS